MRVIHRLAFSESAARDVYRAVQGSSSAEIALALGETNPKGSEACVSHVQEYAGAQKEAGSVRFSTTDMQEADVDFHMQGAEHKGMSHSHLQKLGHVHDWSKQDEQTITQHKNDEMTDYHVLFYRTDVGVDVQAVNRLGETIDVVVGPTKGKIISLFDEGRGAEVKLAA